MPAAPPFNFDTPVILVGGGDVDWQRLEYACGLGLPVVAVDGGADVLRPAGVEPAIIIGDMDSISSTRNWPPRTKIFEIPEQDTTDFEKALCAISAPLYLAFGFLGQRLDHSLAALDCVAKYRTVKSIVLIDRIDLAFAPRVPLRIELPVNSRLSINPLETVKLLSSTGLRYPLNGLNLRVGTTKATSNVVIDGAVSVTPEHPERAGYLVVVPNTALGQVLEWYAASKPG